MITQEFNSSEFLGATLLINKMLGALSLLGSDLNYLQSKVSERVGVYESSFNLGEQNAKSVLQKLIDMKIYIIATDVGRNASCTAQFNSLTDELKIFPS